MFHKNSTRICDYPINDETIQKLRNEYSKNTDDKSQLIMKLLVELEWFRDATTPLKMAERNQFIMPKVSIAHLNKLAEGLVEFKNRINQDANMQDVYDYCLKATNDRINTMHTAGDKIFDHFQTHDNKLKSLITITYPKLM